MAGKLLGASQPTISRYGSLLRPVVRDSLEQPGFGIARLPRGEPVLVDGFLAPCWDWKPLNSCSPPSTAGPATASR
ncbi:hypothetical protein ABZ769_37405 [Streptomyces olivoreticuli]